MRSRWLTLIAVAALGAERGAYAEKPKAPVPHRESGTLVVLPVEAPPVVDGEGGDAAWARTPTFAPIASPCFESADEPVGEKDKVTIDVRACATREAVFLRVVWSDAKAEGEAQGTADTLELEWGKVQSQVVERLGRLVWSAATKSADGASAGAWKDGRWTVELRCPGLPAAADYVLVSRTDSSSAGMPGATAEAWLRRGSAVRVVDFESDRVGDAPKGFRSGLAGQGGPGSWRVRAGGAGANGNVVVQEDGKGVGQRYPLAILEGLKARDVDVSVRFQGRDGHEDRGAGLVWRVKGDHDFYVLRANTLEQNVVQYLTKDNLRVDLPPLAHEADYGVSLQFDPAAWHTLRASMVGDRIQAYLDGRHLFDVVDGSLAEAGLVGLWTKADSIMAFDDLVIVTLDPPASAPGR
jgi:hypothetical protein